MLNEIKKFVNNSLFFENIDKIIYLTLILLMFVALFMPSEIMGAISLIFSALVIFKIIFSNQRPDFKFENYERALIVWFLIVTVSLFGSSLFALSLHGYIKTFIYILFYFCAAQFFLQNKNKITSFFLIVACFMSYESIVAIIQNHAGINQISGWQDMTNLNPEQIISRAYGTLQPYNPNLLAGYLLCGLSSFVFLALNYLKSNKKILGTISVILFLINLVAIIYTGCRGAYLGFMLFFPILFYAIFIEIKNKNGFSKIKKRYKNLIVLISIALLGFVLTNPAIISRFQSILAFRADSSISFRMNVYNSAFKMFLDNIFLGIGVGNQNFREIYGLYMQTGYDALGSYCVPLELAVESGIFALVAFILFVFFAIKKCVSIIKASSNDYTKILALSIILMMCAVFGHGFFDTIWFRPQVQFLFWTYIAILKCAK